MKVTLSAHPERPVDIPLILTNQGASDDDYSLSATNLTFNSGETEKTFTFTAADDAEDDDGRVGEVHLRDPANGHIQGRAQPRRPSPSPTTTCLGWRELRADLHRGGGRDEDG